MQELVELVLCDLLFHIRSHAVGVLQELPDAFHVCEKSIDHDGQAQAGRHNTQHSR